MFIHPKWWFLLDIANQKSSSTGHYNQKNKSQQDLHFKRQFLLLGDFFPMGRESLKACCVSSVGCNFDKIASKRSRASPRKVLCFLVGGFNLFEKYARQIGKSSLRFGDLTNIIKYLEPNLPLFWLERTFFWRQNKGHLGSRYIYIYIEYLIRNFSSWWFQPISKILVRLDHFPR